MLFNKEMFKEFTYKILTVLFLIGYNFTPPVLAIDQLFNVDKNTPDQLASVTAEGKVEVPNEVPVKEEIQLDDSEDILSEGISDPEWIAKEEEEVVVENEDVEIIEKIMNRNLQNISEPEFPITLLSKTAAMIADAPGDKTTDWPGCGFQCEAGDVTVRKIEFIDSSGNPINQCTPDIEITGKIRFSVYNNSNSERLAMILLGDIYQGGVKTETFQTNGVPGTCVSESIDPNTVKQYDYEYTWTCGELLSIKNLTLSWTTGNETCSSFFDSPSCTNRTTKCYSNEGFVVSTPLVADFEASPVCLGNPTQFENKTTGGVPAYSYNWNFGDTQTSTLQDPTHIYATAGLYGANLTVNDSSVPVKTDSQLNTITVWNNPVADFSFSPITGNAPLSVTFTDSSTNLGGSISSWSWDFGDGSTSTEQNPTHEYESVSIETTYTISLIVEDINGCTHSISKDIVIKPSAGKITVIKNIINNDGGTLGIDDFEITLTDSDTTNQGIDLNFVQDTIDKETYTAVVENVLSGLTYTVSEAVLTDLGYSAENGWNCVDENNSVNVITNPFVLGVNQNVTCTITNDDIAPTLTVIKNVIDGNNIKDDISFFEITLPGSSLTFNDGEYNPLTFTTEYSATTTIEANKNYTLSESLLDEYEEGVWECEENNTEIGVGSVQNQSVSLNLSLGQDVTCSITNTKYSSISGHKWNDLDGIGGTTDDKSNPINGWTIFIDANSNDKLDSGEISDTTEVDGSYLFDNLEPGTYKIMEVLQLGWINITGKSQEITIFAGEDKSDVDFSNAKYPTIQVIKKIDTDGDGDIDIENATDWTWKIGTIDTYGTGIDPVEKMPGQYTISEVRKDNYHVTSLVCVKGNTELYNQKSESAIITLQSGDNVVCTFTNTRDTGTLIVKKVVDNDNGGILQADDFSFKVNDDDSTKFIPSTTDPLLGENTIRKVLTGPYSITESEANQRGYTTTYDNCSGVILSNNETETCTITNTSTHGKIILKKIVVPSDDETEFEFTGDLNGIIGNGEELSDIVTRDTYVVTEKPVEGWVIDSIVCEDPTENSGANPENESQILFNVDDGETVICTVTNSRLGEISGYKFEDNDGDGLWDDGELGLSDWEITAQIGNKIITKTTDENGYYEFENLPFGTYVVRETAQDGWTQTSINPENIPISAGDEIEDVNFGNFKHVTINVSKDVVGIDESTDVIDTKEFTALLNNADGKAIAESTTATYTITEPGTYTVSEAEEKDYKILGCFLGDDEFTNYKVESGQIYNVVCKNAQLPAKLIVRKNVVNSQNIDEEIFSEDEFDVVLGEEETKQMADKLDGKIKAEFDGLQPDDYTFTETPKEGYVFEGCTDGGMVTLGSNQTVEVACTNKIIDPLLEIEKTNNKQTIDQIPGDEVIYTLIVTAPQRQVAQEVSFNQASRMAISPEVTGKYIVEDVVVSDIAPSGFKYIPGTWTAKSSINPDLTVDEPVYDGRYAATWELGDMQEGEVITLTYKTQISLLTDSGTYPDIAWVKGKSVANVPVLGNISPGASTPFVGTDVTVIEPLETEEGEVLGATTYLPNTGSSTYLTFASLITMILGFVTLLLSSQKKYLKKLALSFVLLFLIFPSSAFAFENLIVKIEEPKSPTGNQSFNIDFTAQDINEESIAIECYKNDVLFFTLTGNSGSCPVTVETSGTYTFYVKAKTSTSEVQSATVTVVVDLATPLPVVDYTKTNNVLSFKTANDGRSSMVEIFRSDKSTFIAKSASRLTAMSVVPNTAYSYTDTTVEEGKTYYYALRAVDSLGNVSTIVADKTVVILPVSTNSTATVTVASVPQNGGNAIQIDQEGEVAGVKEEEKEKETDGEVEGEKDETENKETIQEKVSKSVNTYWYVWGIGFLLLGGLVYIYGRRNKKN